MKTILLGAFLAMCALAMCALAQFQPGNGPRSTFGGNAAGNTVSASGTQYLAPGTNSISSTQNQRSFIIGFAGVLRNLYVATLSSQNAGGSLVCAITKNNATPTAVSVTFAAGDSAETKSDTTHTLAVAAGDVLSLQCVNNYGGGTSGQLGNWSVAVY